MLTTERRGGVSFMLGLLLFIGVAGRLDARLPWNKP
jgi:hypothetical protein